MIVKDLLLQTFLFTKDVLNPVSLNIINQMREMFWLTESLLEGVLGVQYFVQ